MEAKSPSGVSLPTHSTRAKQYNIFLFKGNPAMKLYTTFKRKTTENAHFYATYRDCVWIFFYVVGQQEWLNCGLPAPSLLIPLKHSYYIGYKIEGYFSTQKNRKFLQDIIARFVITLAHEGAQKVEYLHYKPYLDNKDIIHYNEDYIYNLRDDIAPCLLSLQETKKRDKERDNLLATIGQYTNSEDELFDAIRFTIYDFVKMNGKDALTYDYVETIAQVKYEIIGSKKGWSTAKAKAKAIYKWVKENYRVGTGKNNWNYKRKTKDDEELKMTRRENMMRINEKKKRENRKKVLDAVNELKSKNERVTIRKVASIANVAKATAEKYLKELREANEI